MQFTIEVSDFWLDEEKELEPALRNHIIRDVVSKIEASIKQKIDDHIQKEVKSQVEQSLYRKINSLVGEIIATDKVKGKYTNDKEMTLQEWIHAEFFNNTGYRSPEETIKGLAKKYGDEMKQRYDLLFASQIVAKMSDNGFLREDAMKLLLETVSK